MSCLMPTIPDYFTPNIYSRQNLSKKCVAQNCVHIYFPAVTRPTKVQLAFKLLKYILIMLFGLGICFILYKLSRDL